MKVVGGDNIASSGEDRSKPFEFRLVSLVSSRLVSRVCLPLWRRKDWRCPCAASSGWRRTMNLSALASTVVHGTKVQNALGTGRNFYFFVHAKLFVAWRTVMR